MKEQIITLTGDNFTSYQAGVHYGTATALKDCAAHAEKLEHHFRHQLSLLSASVLPVLPTDSALRISVNDLPNLSVGLVLMASQLMERSRAQAAIGTKIVNRLNYTLSIRDTLPARHSWLTVFFAVTTVLAVVYALTLSR